MTNSRPAVELRDLHKTFGAVQAVRGVDLTIQRGEVVALLGPNGAGKTTTVDLMLGLGTPTEGSVEIFGMTPRRAVQHGLVSAVMQTGGLLKDLTVAETVDLTASLFSHSRPTRECLERAGIADLADRRVAKCSGGQQQRVRFAMALVSDPALVLLDEPTSGMDVEGRRSFWEAIHADADRGRTVVFATHYLEEADQFADRVVLMSRGQIVADGTTAHIKSLVSGSLVRASVEGLPEAEVAAQVRALDDRTDVSAVERLGDHVVVTTSDSDAVARHLLDATALHHLEITNRGLEDAFLALTGDTARTGDAAQTGDTNETTATEGALR